MNYSNQATGVSNPVKVLFVATSYPSDLSDWRGLFIRHLADALARREDLAVSLLAPPGEMHPRIIPATTVREANWLAGLMAKGGIAQALRAGGWSAISTPIKLLSLLRAVFVRHEPVDIYHINWLQNALPLLANGKPLLISVLGSDMPMLTKPGMLFLMRRVFRHHPTIICPNAEWMIPLLKEAFPDVVDVRFVPFGIDPAWFDMQRTLPLSEPKRWLAVTRLTRAKLGSLFEWCAPLFEGQPQRELHLFGPMQETIELPPWAHYHGAVSPEDLNKHWFPGAQGLITLSRHAEGRPQVMLEAMAAGLPIIASRLPAHENIVFHRKTGWLCDDPSAVAQGVSFFENERENQLAGQRARVWAKQKIGTWDDCAARYASIYQLLLQGMSK